MQRYAAKAGGAYHSRTITRIYFSISRAATQALPDKSEDFFPRPPKTMQNRRSRPPLACRGDQIAMPFTGRDSAPINARCTACPHGAGRGHNQRSGRPHPCRTGPGTIYCSPPALPSSCSFTSFRFKAADQLILGIKIPPSAAQTMEKWLVCLEFSGPSAALFAHSLLPPPASRRASLGNITSCQHPVSPHLSPFQNRIFFLSVLLIIVNLFLRFVKHFFIKRRRTAPSVQNWEKPAEHGSFSMLRRPCFRRTAAQPVGCWLENLV